MNDSLQAYTNETDVAVSAAPEVVKGFGSDELSPVTLGGYRGAEAES